MSKRTSLLISLGAAAASPPPPNAVVAAVTVEIRAAWPASMGHGQTVRQMLDDAYESAIAELDAKEAEPAYLAKAA